MIKIIKKFDTANVAKTFIPASVFHGKLKKFDKHALAGLFQNIFIFFQKKFANQKTFRIFAPFSILKGGFVRLYVAGIFCACTQIHGVTPVVNCNGTPAFEVENSGSVAPFFHAAKQTNFSKMFSNEKSCLNGRKASNSNRVAHDTRPTTFRASTRPSAPLLTITGAVTNPFLYSIRKAFREFLIEESKGYCYAVERLDKKLHAAELLFPDERKMMYRSLTAKN